MPQVLYIYNERDDIGKSYSNGLSFDMMVVEEQERNEEVQRV